MAISTPTNLDYLIDFVRLRVGDMDSSAYRYTEEWIRTSLVSSVELMGRWLNYKYLLDSNYNIYRNPHGYFIFPEATYGIVEPADNQLIVLMAAYIMLEGSLENSAWDYVSWKDAEITFSNLESSRARGNILKAIWEELNSLMKPPVKRLARAKKGDLPGYLKNRYEIGDMK